MRPVVGIVCCTKRFGEYGTPNHAVSATNIRAVAAVSGAVPVLIPADLEACDLGTLLPRLDGLMLTGSRSNVRPALYGGPPHPEGTPEDEARDAVSFALIRAALARDLPLLAICRGMQELNAALGGTLHQEVRALEGRLDHSTPKHPDASVRTGKSHAVRLAPGGLLERLGTVGPIMVNSLHDQGVDRVADGLAVEATAPDGTVEALRLAREDRAFLLAVQWHPEYDWRTDPVSRAIFEAFGDAMRATAR